MQRRLYLLGLGYVAVCGLLIVGYSKRTSAPAVRLTHDAAGTGSPGGTGADWFRQMKPYCNAVEVESQQARYPAPATSEGGGYSAACYALAGKIDRARGVIAQLPGDAREYAAAIVFGIGHPVADTGDDKSAGPIMELVLEYLPDHYMALYHAGMSEYILGQPDLAQQHLKRFLELYQSNDGWRRNALEVLSRLTHDMPGNN